MKCKAILCDDPTRKGWCRKHRHCATSEAFGAALKPRIESLPGATFLPSMWDENGRGWQYELPSRAGKLTVTFIRESYTLFSRFEDPKAGNKLRGGHGFLGDEVNPYSGKWNHVIDWEHPVDSAVIYVMAQLGLVL